MRLTCPACGAQYAPPEGAIPEGGRIVRCSACRAEWRATPGAETTGSAKRSAAADVPALSPQPETAPATRSPAPEAALAGSLETEPAEGGGSGFMAGFAAVALVALAALGLYLNHQAVADAAPALAGPVDAFVNAVDALRLQLARLLGTA
jgi:predicted Zn finger-like uncharacterized protein